MRFGKTPVRVRLGIGWVVGACVALSGVAACGPATPGGTVEVFSWWTEGGEKASFEGLVQVFRTQCEDQRFVNGAVEGGAGGNARGVLATRLARGAPPDTFQAHAGGELSDYIRAGQLQDLSSDYAAWGLDRVLPRTLVESLRVDGKIYSVPVNIHRANLVWANPTVLAKAQIGRRTPPSIDAWIKDMKVLQSWGVEEPLALGTGWTQVMLLETVLLADLGPQRFRTLWRSPAQWRSRDVARAIAHYDALLDFTNADRDAIDWPESTALVTGLQAAYTVMGDWVPGTLDSEGLTLGTDFMWFPVPGTQGTFQFLSDSFTLPVGAKNPEGTKCWLRVVGSAQGQRVFNIRKGSIPARTDARPSDYSAYQQQAMRDWTRAELVPSLAHGSAASTGWLDDVTTAVSEFSVERDPLVLRRKLVAAAEAHTGR